MIRAKKAAALRRAIVETRQDAIMMRGMGAYTKTVFWNAIYTFSDGIQRRVMERWRDRGRL